MATGVVTRETPRHRQRRIETILLSSAVDTPSSTLAKAPEELAKLIRRSVQTDRAGPALTGFISR